MPHFSLLLPVAVELPQYYVKAFYEIGSSDPLCPLLHLILTICTHSVDPLHAYLVFNLHQKNICLKTLHHCRLTMSARHWTCLHQKRRSPPEGASRNISKYFTQNNQSPFYQYLCWQLEFYPLSYRLVRSFQSQKMLYLLIRCHPVQKKRTNSKWIFTEKIMPESKSLGKRYKEKRCHLMGCNDSSGKLGRWPM